MNHTNLKTTEDQFALNRGWTVSPLRARSTARRRGHSGRKLLLGAVLLLGVGSARSTILYNNGPLITHPGQGYGGADASAIAPGLDIYGYGFSMHAGQLFRLADDFTVPSNETWNITAVKLYGYQTGSGTASTLTDLRAQIWNGRPGDAGASVVWGNLTDNILASSSFSGIYRVGSTAPYTNSTRPIMELNATVNTTLTAGSYWLDWTADGSLNSGPWDSPISIANQPSTGNGRQFQTPVWADANAGTNQQGLPFQIQGESVPEPGQWALMGVTLLGVGGMAMRQCRRKAAR